MNDSTGVRIQQWYTAADAGCAAGTGTCSVSPYVILTPGPAIWWIQTWNSFGLGPWSSAMNFTAPSPPGAATLVSPSGLIATHTPTYTWDAVPGATWYYLWVNDSTGIKIQHWYTAAAEGCDVCATCSVTPATALATGASVWWIQTWNAGGVGPWSSPMAFTVP